MSNPVLTFNNKTTGGMSVVIYDSFPNDPMNYFGKLTELGNGPIASGSNQKISAIRTISTFIVFFTDDSPVCRIVYNPPLGGGILDLIDITDAQVDAMKNAMNFVDNITQSPNSTLAKSFAALNNEPKENYLQKVDSFFAATKDYKHLTFPLYLLALTAEARNPKKVPNLPLERQPYSMKTLCRYLGGTWPDNFPDIQARDFKCEDDNNVLDIKATIILADLPYPKNMGPIVLKLIPLREVEAEFEFSHQANVSALSTVVKFTGNDLVFFEPNHPLLELQKPTISFTISPLFQFVKFSISSELQFKILDLQFDILLHFTLDNMEVALSAEIKYPPPIMDILSFLPPFGSFHLPGVHLHEFGFLGGIFFDDPPSIALGLEGQYEIGNVPNFPRLDDDRYVIACAYDQEGEVPIIIPKYLSFYVPEVDLPTMIAAFTTFQLDIDFPLQARDISFHGAFDPEQTLEPVALPDGTLAQPGYGFSAYLDLFSLELFGTAEVGFDGVKGIFSMDPLSMGSILKLTGKGQAISRKVDANGSFIQNNMIPTTMEAKQVIAQAKTKQIINPGGPELKVNTSTNPYLMLNIKAQLFDLISDEIDASVTKSGVSFELEQSALLMSKLECHLTNWHNFYADTSFGLNDAIPLPTIKGYSLGKIKIGPEIKVHFELDTSSTDIDFKVNGQFDFMGRAIQFASYNEKTNLTSLEAFIEAVKNQIITNAKKIFSFITEDAKEWATLVEKKVIADINNVVQGLKTAFDKTAKEAEQMLEEIENSYGKGEQDGFKKGRAARAALFKAAGFVATEVAQAFDIVDKVVKEELAPLLKAAGYDAGEVGQALKDVYGLGADAIAPLLKAAGYGADEVGHILKDVYGLGADGVASVLKAAGYGAGEVGQALKDVYGLGADAIAPLLKAAGYGADEVGHILKDVYGLGADGVASALHAAGCGADEVSQALKDVYGLGADAIAPVLKAARYSAEEVGYALKDVYHLGADEAASALHAAGCGADEVGKALKDVYRLGADAIAPVLKAARYSAEEVGYALKDVYHLGADGVASALHAAGCGADEVSQALKDVYGLGADAIAPVLKAARYSAEEVGYALKDVYHLGADGVASALHAAGCGADEVGQALKDVYGLGADAIAPVLKAARYSAEEVGYALKDVYHLGADGVESALNAAGYGVGEIEGFIKGLFP